MSYASRVPQHDSRALTWVGERCTAMIWVLNVRRQGIYQQRTWGTEINNMRTSYGDYYPRV